MAYGRMEVVLHWSSALNNTIFMNEPRNDHTEPISLVSGRDSNQAPVERKPEALPLEPSAFSSNVTVCGNLSIPAGLKVDATFSCAD
jgi:hypothetical protein